MMQSVTFRYKLLVRLLLLLRLIHLLLLQILSLVLAVRIVCDRQQLPFFGLVIDQVMRHLLGAVALMVRAFSAFGLDGVGQGIWRRESEKRVGALNDLGQLVGIAHQKHTREHTFQFLRIGRTRALVQQTLDIVGAQPIVAEHLVQIDAVVLGLVRAAECRHQHHQKCGKHNEEDRCRLHSDE